MYEYLSGTLMENHISSLVIDVHGIGYKVLTPPGSIHYLPQENCKIYTSFVVRENAQLLYGFIDASARNLFEILINISGVGPKTALCILSQFTPERFQEAVMTNDTKLIASVPGLGKKTAEKIILDLKDKLAKMSLPSAGASAPKNPVHYDAIQALVNLGFTEKAAGKAIEKVTDQGEKQLELSDLITQALRVH